MQLKKEMITKMNLIASHYKEKDITNIEKIRLLNQEISEEMCKLLK
jgi:hypothetical protein